MNKAEPEYKKVSKINNLLEIRGGTHPDLGKLFVLYSPSTGPKSAYYLDFNKEQEVGIGLRLTPETARKLADKLLEVVGLECEEK